MQIRTLGKRLDASSDIAGQAFANFRGVQVQVSGANGFQIGNYGFGYAGPWWLAWA